MVFLTGEQIEWIESDIRQKGITLPGLDTDVLDHLICGTEHYLNAGNPFAQAYPLALRDLTGDEAVGNVQQETLRAVRTGKSIYKNLLIYGAVLGGLIGVFGILAEVTSPGLILPAISLALFCVYHCFFYFRTGKGPGSNLLWFVAITALPVVGLAVFLAEAFPGFRWLGTQGWCLLLTAVGLGLYYHSVRKILAEPRTTRQLLIQLSRFLGVSSLLWVPLAAYVKLFKPGADVFFFDELLMLSLAGFLCMLLLQKAPAARLFLRNRF
ncbi:MAG: hypothetical protein ICV83_33850 [Cytophagales bacterium]|nr:hypothetical protein [Cytophagales bacterium]